MDKLNVYKKYFETASDDTYLVMHRGYALTLARMVEEQQEELEHLKFVMRKYHKYANQDFAKKYGIEL